MRKCAILIGLDKTKAMPPLNAAVKGATEMYEWAKDQGYEAIPLTDEEQDVTIAMVHDTIDHFVRPGVYDLMLIYFGGHGILKSPGTETWLLSNAMSNSYEAIDVVTSKAQSSLCGIPHVVFISDACRKSPTARQMAIQGGNIFPIDHIIPNPNVNVDLFYATLPGDPAWETRSSAGNNNNGLYTKELLKGLKGEVHHIIQAIYDDNRYSYVIMSRELGKHLKWQIPEMIRQLSLPVSQQPISEITSESPHYLSKIGEEDPQQQSQQQQEHQEQQQQVLPPGLKERLENVIAARNPNKSAKQQVNKTIGRLKYSEQPDLQEIHTGLKVTGTTVSGYIVNGNQVAYVSYGKEFVLSFAEGEYPLTALILTKNGHGVPLAILPGFIGLVTFENNRVINISYMPSRQNERYGDYEIQKHEIEERKALVATASRFGVFESGRDAGDYLRRFKALDPILGLFAVYAYAKANDFEGIRSVYRYMRREREPVLNDVSLLAKFSGIETDRRFAPYFPVLTQGWSYLPLINDGRISTLTGMLVPGLWTTFTKEGYHYILENQLLNR